MANVDGSEIWIGAGVSDAGETTSVNAAGVRLASWIGGGVDGADAIGSAAGSGSIGDAEASGSIRDAAGSGSTGVAMANSIAPFWRALSNPSSGEGALLNEAKVGSRGTTSS